MNSDKIRENIINLVSNFYYAKREEAIKNNRINYAGQVMDNQEMINLVNVALDEEITYGKYYQEFEDKLKNFLEIRYLHLCNSGSSANYLAFMALTSELLGDRKINRGDEVITVAACFPTTVSPIINYGAMPVFVDITIPEYNINVDEIEKAITEKTKAIILAHTLGNPFNLSEIKKICEKYNLWLIEDNCDSLGSKYYIDENLKYTGTIGDIGTSSFYPAHHITTGEGGAVYTNNALLSKIILSFRDWGRDCICNPKIDNTCNNRFNGQYGKLPQGYDHKYVYSHFGYNMKMTNMQAAIGLAQINKLEYFIEKRIQNYDYLKSKLSKFNDIFILPESNSYCSWCSWFSFLITIIEDKVNFTRDELIRYLETNGIQTRMLFAGNITKQPCFNNVEYRIIENLKNTDYVMNNSFFIGVYPDMTSDKIDYIVECIAKFISR